MTLRPSQSELQQRFSSGEKHNNWNVILHRLFFSFALLTVICLTASAASAKPKFPTISLPEKSQGNRAIQALAGKLPEVAAWYGTTPQQFASMMIQDNTAWIDAEGRLFFVEEFPEPVVEGESSALDAAAFPYDQTFKLHSRPGAKRVLFLDFDGHMLTGTAWNASYGDPIISPAYDTDGDRTSFSNAEMDRIQNVWRSVAEDYAPFDVDVTTEDPGQDAITRSSSTDDRYGTRVVMTVDDFAGCGCGGFAYVGVFDNTGDYYKPAFVFNTSEVGVAEAVSHEVGHNLGLYHDGVINGASYYTGHGSGVTGWAPIMGVGYYKQLVQWSQGEYTSANNTQDDIQIIQNNGALLMVDDHGNDQANSTALGNTTDGITVTLNGTGLIERRTDIDFFRFVSGSGNVSITIDPVPFSPNLDILAELYDANSVLIATSNPVDGLSASINETALPAGEYFISIDGVGKGDPLVTGYTDYASLGQYSISGNVPDPGGLQSPVAIAAATLPLNAPAPFTLYLFGNESYDSDGSIQSYEWNFGDGSDNSFNSDPAHTYYAPGNYMATLTVVDNDGLSDSDTVSITVENKAPIAMASADFTSGTAPLTVIFDSVGSNDPDAPYGMITGYSWDFGDGVSSNTTNASHTYNSAGIFIATLTVTDDFGDTGTDTITINVSQPPAINQYPISESYVSGTVTGSYTNTFTDDGVAESIRERESGGKRNKRYSYLEHVWVIPVQSGNSVALFINAWQSSTVDYDSFVFAYSSDGGSTYVDALTINNTTDDGVVPVLLPPDTQGNVLIRVLDTDRSRGNKSLDTVFVDELYISTENQPGVPPSAPTGLDAIAVSSGLINLSWVDNAVDEYGFCIERSIDYGVSWNTVAMVGKDIQAYSDTNVGSDTTYWYQISAYSGSGQSGYDGPVNATTYPVSIVFSANGYKMKRVKKVDLTWSNATTDYVDIYRNGTLIDTIPNTFPYAYTDNLGKGGGGSYTYHICESSSSSNCSDNVTVNF